MGFPHSFLIDDGTSIIPIFEATQAAQVDPNDLAEPVVTIAQQAQLRLNRSNACKAHQAQANRENTEIEREIKAQLAENNRGNVQPKAKKRG